MNNSFCLFKHLRFSYPNSCFSYSDSKVIDSYTIKLLNTNLNRVKFVLIKA